MRVCVCVYVCVCVRAACSIDKCKALSLVVHCADISHPAKAWNMHQRWTDLLVHEFFRQVPAAHRVKYKLILYLESIRPIRTAENFEAVEWETGFSNKHVLAWLR